jgi:drug/metabolite transporter (DMT)-like permease
VRQIDPRAIVVHFSAVALLFCLASLFLFDRAPDLPGVLAGPAPWMLLGVGLTATAGQLLLTRAFAAGPPARVSVIALTQVVFAMAFDVFLWERSFNPLTLVGIVLVLAPTGWLMAGRVEY